MGVLDDVTQGQSAPQQQPAQPESTSQGGILDQVTAPPTNETNSAAAPKTAPPVKSTATMSAYHPSIWDRVEDMFRYANPNTRPRIQPKDRDDNSMQIIRPEELMSETEQQEHPMATAIGQAAGEMTSPESVAILAGTAGFGELPAAARGILPRLISAGFSAQSLYNAYETYPAIKDAFLRGDLSETERLLTHAVLDVGMAALAGQHAAKGETGAGTPTQYEKSVTERVSPSQARAGFAKYVDSEGKINPHSPETVAESRGTVRGKSQYGLKPTTQTTAGVEAPVSALQGDEVTPQAKVAARLTTPGAAQEFQKSQTAPAATRQAISTVGQVAEDLINRHDAIVNGAELPEQLTGTQTPSRLQSFDDISAAAEKKAVETTYQKADTISARETADWQRQAKQAISTAKEASDHYNQLVDEHNSQLGTDEKPMERQQFDPSSVELPEKPQGYGELKGAVDRAKANSRSADASVRQEAFDNELPKAEKSLDQWFRSHSDEISPEEYDSAKKLRYSAERFKEISNGLRRGILNSNITGNTMRGIEATMDNKKNLGPGTFQRLLGPEGYQNWREVARLFDPVKDAPAGIKAWGQWALEYTLAHLLGPLGVLGKAGTELMLNKIMFNHDWGKWFRSATSELKESTTESAKTGEPVRLSSKLSDTFKSLYNSDQRGLVGADINKPRFGRTGLGGAAVAPALEQSPAAGSADAYNENRGSGPVQAVTPEVHPQGQDIADAFQKMAHDPSHPATAKSYAALRDEVNAQWDHAEKDGFKFEPWTQDGQPYSNSREMREDVGKNKHLYFFRGGDIPADHPLAAVDPKTGLTFNDKLRAVHDLYGHAAGGYEFGPKGEEAAYKTHAQMFSPDAIPALTTETRGQNNWVNYGPHMRDADGNILNKGDAGYLSPTERPYAQQKVGLLPEKFQAGSASEKLIQKYGTTNDVLKAGFILPEGDMVPLTGEHDHMLGAKTTDNAREQFIKDSGAIRSRYRMSRAGEEQVFSLPDEVTEDQVRRIRDAASKLKNGRVILETVGDKQYKVLDSPTGSKVMDALASLVKTKETPETFAGEERRSQRRAPMGATELEDAIKNRKPISTPFDQTEGAMGTVRNDPAMQAIDRAFRPVPNASGESAASLEAIGRQSSERSNGIKRVKVLRNGQEVPLIGPDAVDVSAGPGETIVKRFADGHEEIQDQGQGARYNPRDPQAGRLKQLVAGNKARESQAEASGLRGVDTQTASASVLSEALQAAARENDAAKREGSEIATRRPTSKRVEATNVPGQYADMDGVRNASQAQPGGDGKLGYAEKLARTVSKYNGLDFTDEQLKSPRAVMEKFVNRMTDNLVALHNAIPEPMRDTARSWYDTANKMSKMMAQKYDMSHEQAAGVLAALSPQNAWDNNVGLADRLLDTYKNRQNFAFSPKMEAAVAKVKQGQLSRAGLGIVRDVTGKTLSELANQPMPERLKKKWGAEAGKKWENVKAAQQGMWVRLYDEAHNSSENPTFHPNGDVIGVSPYSRSWIGLDHIAKAIRIVNDGSVEAINRVMGDGNKIRNFYNNIINPNSKNGHVTVDTHAVGAAHFQPFSGDDAEVQHNFGNSPKGIPGAPKHAGTGMRGTYPLYAEAYRRAAEKLGLQPRELQSITWEGMRSLMGGTLTDDKKTPEFKSFAREVWQKVQERELTPKQAREMIIEKAGGFSKPSWMTDERWDEAMGTGFDPEGFKNE